MDNRLHTGVGPFVLPGTGPVDNSREEFATKNIEQFVKDVDLDKVISVRAKERDYGEGRFAYLLSREGKEVEVQMPGWPIEQVRYTDDRSQNIWDFPRLYIDGSSWVWKFALDITRSIYNEKEDED